MGRSSRFLKFGDSTSKEKNPNGHTVIHEYSKLKTIQTTNSFRLFGESPSMEHEWLWQNYTSFEFVLIMIVSALFQNLHGFWGFETHFSLLMWFAVVMQLTFPWRRRVLLASLAALLLTLWRRLRKRQSSDVAGGSEVQQVPCQVWCQKWGFIWPEVAWRYVIYIVCVCVQIYVYIYMCAGACVCVCV